MSPPFGILLKNMLTDSSTFRTFPARPQRRMLIEEIVETFRDMREELRTPLSLTILYLWTVIVNGDVLASLAPPVHLQGERVGWTILVCVITDLGMGHLEVNWRSPREMSPASAPYSVAGDQHDSDRSAVAIVTVATSEWASYSCFVSHRQHTKVLRTHHATFTELGESIHKHPNQVFEAIGWWTDHVTLQALRLLLLKTTVFNVLVTTCAVIKW
ncbi:hypothetical protein UPYG_G00183380 [Umbra pygmaea]|uniref:Ig-like domain-containing protein n=1 Tax=Umbra pygmaea TaxID=75934 RepID=A0ABD0X9V3_UMBPY